MGCAFLEDVTLDAPVNFVVVVAAFLVQFSIWGVRASLAAFTHAIDRDPDFCDCYGRPEFSNATLGDSNALNAVYKCCDEQHLVATAVGIACGLGPVFGVAAGYLSGRFGARLLVVVSAVCVAASLLLSTLATDRVAFLLVYGPLMGIGSGFMVTPGAFAVGTRFEKLLPFAMGIVYGGGGAGSAAIPRVAGQLLSTMGAADWREVQRYLSISTILCFFMGAIVHERRKSLIAPPSPKPVEKKSSINSRRYVDIDDVEVVSQRSLPITEDGDESTTAAENHAMLKKLLFSKKYIVSLLSAVFYGYSYYAALFCLIPYARAHGDPTNKAYAHYTPISLDEASSMMLAFGLAQCTGSVVLGLVSTKINFYKMNLFCTIASSATLIAIPNSHTLASIAACSALLGLFSAGCRLCFPSMVTNMFLGPCLGSMIGLTLMGYGLGALPGPPLSSEINNLQNGNFSASLYVMAASVLFSGLLSFFVMQRFAPKPTDEEKPLME